MRKHLQFNLRSLLILVTLLCVGFAAAAYKLRLLQPTTPGNFSGNCRVGPGDPAAIAGVVRDRVSALPGHTITQDAVDRLIPSQNDSLKDGVPPFYATYYHVKLPDGSRMHVGFWVYHRPILGTMVSYRAYSRDSYRDLKSGAVEKRRVLRTELDKMYREIVRVILHDAREAHERQAAVP